MHYSKITALAALFIAAAQPVVSTIYVTNPVQSTKAKGGDKLDIKWKDDGKTPTLKKDWGGVNIYLAVGSQTTQFSIQTLAQDVKTSKKSGSYKIDPSVGGNMNKYFIRFESTNLGTDGKPYLAFSALFTLSGMSGNFNSTVQAAINAQTGTTGGSSSGSGTGAGTSPGSTVTSPAKANLPTTPASVAPASHSGALGSANSTSPALPNHVANVALVSFGALAAGAGAFYL